MARNDRVLLAARREFFKMWDATIREGVLISHMQAARVLGVSDGFVDSLVQRGMLTPFRFFGKPYVSGTEVLTRARQKRGVKK